MTDMKIDCYGRGSGESGFGTPMPAREIARKHYEGATYIRYGDDVEAGPIHRIEIDDAGCWERTWAWGAWGEAETLDYAPLSELREVGG